MLAFPTVTGIPIFPELIDNVVSRLKFGPSFFGTFVQMAAMSNHFIDVNRVHDFLQSYLRLSDLFQVQIETSKGDSNNTGAHAQIQ